ncbi:MAG: LysM peptidoglycan-binding domain-containing protein [Chthoniobacterales bacterium]|nr:LysM peptidoglycan-binding domain-containing protein [Chthoniobacterales bacterium]
MRSSKIFILIGVAFVIFGSAALCAYLLFVKPYSSFHLFHPKQAAVKAAPAPDQGETAFNAALALQNSGKPEEAITAWKAWLQAYPESKKASEGLANLGKANLDLLRSPSTAGGKESYIVVKGDSLDRIANKKKSNAELIQQVNSLPNINLQIGQELFIPQLQMTIVLDRAKKLLTLQNGDQFFKSYSLLSNPPATNAKETTTLIVEKVAMNGNKRVAFGDKKYPASERIIILRSCGNIVAAPAETASAATPAATDASTNAPAATPTAMPPGFVISTSDMSEIFPLVNKAACVTVK